MTNDKFWELIDSFYQGAKEDQELYIEIAQNKLFELSDDERFSFIAYLGYYIGKAEGSEKLMLLGKVIQGFISDDSFLYFAIWLTSRGENIYFSTLKDPDSLIKLVSKNAFLAGSSYIMPEFEMLMSIGIKDDEYDINFGLEDDERKELDKIFKKKVPKETLSFYDMAREIDKYLPESMIYFDFDKSSLDFSFEIEESENTHHQKIKQVEDESFQNLKENWNFATLEQAKYDIVTAKRGNFSQVDMPPFDESIIMYQYKPSKDFSEMPITRCYWYNYKTLEEKEININAKVSIPGRFEYIAGNDEYIFFAGYFVMEGMKDPMLCTYSFASNSFSFNNLPLPQEDSCFLMNMVGQGKSKSGVIHENSVYFSITAYNIAARETSFTQILAYNFREDKVELYKDMACTPKFNKGCLYYLRPVEVSLFENVTCYTLIEQNLDTKIEKEVCQNVENYIIDNDNIYIVYPTSEKNHSVAMVCNGQTEDIITNLPDAKDFSVIDQYMFLYLFMSDNGSGYTHSFILNMNNKNITEVPKGDQGYSAILFNDKYIAIEPIYGEKKVLARIHEVYLK